MPSIPRNLFDFKEQVIINISANSDSEERNLPPLKIQLVEVNTGEIPQMHNFTEWRLLDGTSSWYVCNNSKDYCVINKVNSRVWALYSMAKVEHFKRVTSSWINGNLLLDSCWTSSGSIQSIMKKMNWTERGIGLRYEDCTAPKSNRTSISIKARYGDDADIRDLFSAARNQFSISSLRMKSNSDDGSVSEWYTDGRITVNTSENMDFIIYMIGEISNHYHAELEQATKWRDQEKGSFEFEFSRSVDLERYESRITKGTKDLKMWMVKTEDHGDFVRFGGVDLHTWDRILLDMGDNFAYMTIPGNGCVNAAPRLVTVQGESVTGKTKVYYNGNEIFT